ncbi:hypothetical protein [Lacrimispora sphenoides]|uniref:DUF3068 domain-containing protein n=1 Tax=Lacrimispora sphenoides JCM 1415 TaxID=1297793 RepID=A0ABY1CHZ4_9FIRM|nr:hypothetical protein [Lacrimispora sphenoides]SEU05928.1 hypothetical protein SAMN02745906_4494 [[Clostridium] sphenoides JCM 1415]SUY49061.1 Uncharacterised protein [Lacrimispora sphenoides]
MKNKINRIKKGFVAMFLVAPLVLGDAGIACAEETFIEITKEYRTSIKEEDGRSQFKEVYEKDGIVYRLKSVRTDNVEEIYPGDIITYDSDPFVGNPEKYAPNEAVEKEGKRYALKTSELSKVLTKETTKYSEASILYEGVEYIDSLPEDAQVKVINEDLKQELNVTLPAVGFKEESACWDYNFTFPITVSGYDADSYMLGQTEISNRSPLIDHAILFLSYLNLPSQYYEISSIEWDGDPVSKDGEMIRNATARGRKFVKNIRGIYGGDVTFPSIEANAYHGTYIDAEAENQTEQIIYKKEITATYVRDGRKGFWNFLKWLLANSVTMSILVILLIILLLLVIVKRVRKRSREKKKTD